MTPISNSQPLDEILFPHVHGVKPLVKLIQAYLSYIDGFVIAATRRNKIFFAKIIPLAVDNQFIFFTPLRFPYTLTHQFHFFNCKNACTLKAPEGTFHRSGFFPIQCKDNLLVLSYGPSLDWNFPFKLLGIFIFIMDHRTHQSISLPYLRYFSLISSDLLVTVSETEDNLLFDHWNPRTCTNLLKISHKKTGRKNWEGAYLLGDTYFIPTDGGECFVLNIAAGTAIKRKLLHIANAQFVFPLLIENVNTFYCYRNLDANKFKVFLHTQGEEEMHIEMFSLPPLICHNDLTNWGQVNALNERMTFFENTILVTSSGRLQIYHFFQSQPQGIEAQCDWVFRYFLNPIEADAATKAGITVEELVHTNQTEN